MALSNAPRFEFVPGWEQLPEGYSHGDVVGVAVDSRDRVFILTRYDQQVMVYEPDGRFVTSWGQGPFTGRTHGITIGPDDSVYCVNDGDHAVFKYSPDGELLMTIGTPGVPCDNGYVHSPSAIDVRLSTIARGGPPFNLPTNVAVAPNGELFVSDGYGNARVHRFSADGELIQSWGEPGTGPGEFNLPHGVRVTADGRVMVADRENDRIQVFSPDGEYLEQWTDVQRPDDICIDRDGLIYVAELWRCIGDHSFVHGPVTENRYGRVSVFDPEGVLLSRLETDDPSAPGQFCAPHCICVDSRGDLYVGEVTQTFAVSRGRVQPGCHMFQKFARRQ